MEKSSGFMQFNGAVLIIGSLYWYDSPLRNKWRNNNLKMKEAKMVPVPIRYGRISHSWGETYTMTYTLPDHKTGVQGSGYLVPLMNNPVTVQEMIAQSFHLQSAERKRKGKWETLDWNWGCIGILINPVLRKDTIILKNIWKKHLSVRFNPKLYNRYQEQPVLDEQGKLKLPWLPVYNPFDFILGAMTRAAEYPNAANIANRMLKTGNFEYFRNNLRNGINTFQDTAILKALKSAGVQLDI